MTGSTRILIADDHKLFRAGLIELLETVPEFDVLGDVGTGAAAIAFAEEAKPDVLILDVEMPGLGPTAVMSAVAEASPATRVVVLTMHDDPDLVRSLIGAGASAYLLKTVGRNELVAAVNSAARGEGSVLLSLSRSTALGLARGPAQANDELLSRREHEVLALVAAARSNREIARKLFISEATVKRHLANAYSKLGASSRMEAVHTAVAKGILASAPVPRRDVNGRDDSRR